MNERKIDFNFFFAANNVGRVRFDSVIMEILFVRPYALLLFQRKKKKFKEKSKLQKSENKYVA